MSRSKDARVLRAVRKIHRTLGILLFVFFIIIAVSGLLLGWKKHSAGFILPISYQGTSSDLHAWLPLDSLHKCALQILQDSFSSSISTKIERIEVRQDKGMLKFVFADRYIGMQLDGATGTLLHIEQRRSDVIENIHNGSILDKYLGTSNGQIKLVYTSVMGLALLTFSLTGFWLWYGPKRMRQRSDGMVRLKLTG